jgi:hypothetical protein
MFREQKISFEYIKDDIPKWIEADKKSGFS